MNLPPDEVPAPPVATRPQVLPVDQLSWENFERLCLRLLEAESEIVHVELTNEAGLPIARRYGRRGDPQYGIDIYSRDPFSLGDSQSPRRYVTLQARRVNRVSASDLKSAVEKLLSGRWAAQSRRFIFATSLEAVASDLTDEYERLSEKLAESSIDRARSHGRGTHSPHPRCGQ
jgi:hypothetical protein